jgi:hypothetical protein
MSDALASKFGHSFILQKEIARAVKRGHELHYKRLRCQGIAAKEIAGQKK